MNVQEAYEKLGLAPFGEFLDHTTGDGHIGATTWMTVEAALAVLEGHNVVIISHTLPHSEDIAKACVDYVMKLQEGQGMAIRTHSKGPTSRMYSVEEAGHIHWCSAQTARQFWLERRREDYKVFIDAEFRVMAVQRRDGPFSEVRRLVRQDDGSYAAYTKLNEYLFDLTEEGARQMSDADPYRIVVED